MSHSHFSTQIKKWILIFKKPSFNRDAEARKPEYFTDQKAEAIRRFLHDPKSRFLDLTDDEGNLKETIEKKEIEGLRKIEDLHDKSNSDRRWICDYGTRHEMRDGVYTNEKTGKREWSASKCGCPARFGVTAMEFLRGCQARFKINMAHEITPAMQDEFFRIKSLTH